MTELAGPAAAPSPLSSADAAVRTVAPSSAVPGSDAAATGTAAVASTPPTNSSALRGSAAVSSSNAQAPEPNGHTADEEDYTIKCICDFQDDDGNTVQCETCESWQHIECYYEGKAAPGEEEHHNCVDCEPRRLDGKRATELQRARRSDPPAALERRPKKTAAAVAKSHKKREKSTDHHPASTHVNGTASAASDARHGHAHAHAHGSNGRGEQPPHKKQKTQHKASASIHGPTSAAAAPTKGPNANGRRSASASHPLPSPAKTSHYASPLEPPPAAPYSVEFMHLYDHDPGEMALQANLFNDIATTSNLALWTHDVEAVEEATNGKTQQDIFMRCDQPFASMDWPSLSKRSRSDTSVTYHGRHPKWTYLTLDSGVSQGAMIGELRGKIGHMKDYVRDEANSWEYLRHPLPFVFFHPSLPIYIDTRREGSLCRYLRRSCQPNVVMKTFLENGSDYHFCFVANRDLEAGSELTIAWTPDEHVRAYLQQRSSGVKYEGAADTDESYVMNYFLKVAADFGGCACNNSEECVVLKFERRSRFLSAEPVHTNGKVKKGRRAPGATTHNGRGVNSRSGSEALRLEDDDADDARSTSTSSKSKPQSRDMTPSNADTKVYAQGIELSDREKRKIAALEKMDLDKAHSATKRKKRDSGGANAAAKHSPSLTAPLISPLHDMPPDGAVDGRKQKSSATGGQQMSSKGTSINAKASASPTEKVLHSPPPNASAVQSASGSSSRKQYVDASMQTDPDPDGDYLEPCQQPTPRRRYVSLTTRLLRRSFASRVQREEAQTPNASPQSPSDDASGTPEDKKPLVDHDTQMTDIKPVPVAPASPSASAAHSSSPRSTTSNPANSSKRIVAPLDPPPLPPSATATPVVLSPVKGGVNGHRPTDLRVQLPSNAFGLNNGTPSTPTVPASPSVQTPSLYSTTQTPGSLSAGGMASLNGIAPSPVRKMTLGDYISRRGSQNVRADSEAQTNASHKESLEKSVSPSPDQPSEAKGKPNDKDSPNPAVKTAGPIDKDTTMAEVIDDNSTARSGHPVTTASPSRSALMTTAMDKVEAITSLSQA